ncbi:MAG: hypothetical protein LBV49_12060 [Azonexus sp.]|nr:hypothetical protein [Azonexus sp.]
MKRAALLAALAGSLLIHALALWGTAFQWFDQTPERRLLQAELRLPPAPLMVPAALARPKPRQAASKAPLPSRERGWGEQLCSPSSIFQTWLAC